jgi:hypothetical protein
VPSNLKLDSKGRVNWVNCYPVWLRMHSTPWHEGKDVAESRRRAIFGSSRSCCSLHQKACGLYLSGTHSFWPDWFFSITRIILFFVW